MLTDMMPLIFQGAFVVGIIIAIVHVLKIRNDGAKDPMRLDVLTGGERFLTIISGLLGGIIPVGLIYYFGLKKRFPTKAWQVLKMFLWITGIAILVFIAAFAIVEYQLQQARQGLRDAVERAQQQQDQLGEIIPGYSESPTSGNAQPAPPTQSSGSKTPPASSGSASVVSGTQTVPQDSQGPYGDPWGSMTISGTAPVATVEAFIIRSAIENEIPDTSYSTLYNMQWAGTGPLNVSNGTYSGKVKIAKGSYVVFVYDQASRRLLAKGNIDVNINKLWGAPSATINQNSLTSYSSMPTITGTASNTSELNIAINEEYQSIPVVNGKWTFVYKGQPLSSGTYPVLVRLQAPPNTVFVQTTIKVVVQ